MSIANTKINLVFFGTDEFSVIILDQLKTSGYRPSLIITMPDEPRGRHQQLTPPPAKLWAQANQTDCSQPADLKTPGVLDSMSADQRPDLCLVASYGKIIPQRILDLPRHGTLNVHPSLLPKYRGPAPIQAALLNGDPGTGVTIMLVDAQMDHGPILKQEAFPLAESQEIAAELNYPALRDKLAELGGKLLAATIPDWLAGNITPRAQDHQAATYTKMIKKTDGEIKEIEWSTKPLETYGKFLAYQPWPEIYFFDKKNRRVKIIEAKLENNQFIPQLVIPETSGKKMSWADYQHGLGK